MKIINDVIYNKNNSSTIDLNNNLSDGITISADSQPVVLKSNNEVALNNTDDSTYQSVASLYTSGGPGIELNSQFFGSTYSKILISATGSTLIETADGLGLTSSSNITPSQHIYQIESPYNLAKMRIIDPGYYGANPGVFLSSTRTTGLYSRLDMQTKIAWIVGNTMSKSEASLQVNNIFFQTLVDEAENARLDLGKSYDGISSAALWSFGPGNTTRIIGTYGAIQLDANYNTGSGATNNITLLQLKGTYSASDTTAYIKTDNKAYFTCTDSQDPFNMNPGETNAYIQLDRTSNVTAQFGVIDAAPTNTKYSNISFIADNATIAVADSYSAIPSSVFVNKDVILLTTPNTLYSAQQSGDLELRADTTLKLYSDYQNNANMINMTSNIIELSVANTHISNDLWLLLHSGGGTRYLTVDNNGQVGTTTGASPTVYSATFSDISTGTSSFPNNVGFEIGNIPAGNYLFYFGCWAQSSVITTLFADMKIYVQTTSSPVAIESSLMKWEGGDESAGLGVYADAKPFGYSGYPITLSATGTVSCNVIAARPAGGDSVGFYNSYMTIIKI